MTTRQLTAFRRRVVTAAAFALLLPAAAAAAPAPAAASSDPLPPPTDLTATQVGATTIDLAWTAPAKDVSFYELRITNPLGQVAHTQVGGDPPAATLANLEPDSTYLIAVRAWNEVGTSPWSDDLPVTTHPAPLTCEVAYESLVYNIGTPGWLGYQTAVTLTNLGTPVSSWELTYRYPDGQQVDIGWSVAIEQSGSWVTARDMVWNGALPTGGSVAFGYRGQMPMNAGPPVDFALHGLPCDVTFPPPGPWPSA